MSAERSRIHETAFDPPYGPYALEWITRWGAIEGRGTPADPELVAHAVLGVVSDSDPPAQVIVGEDAERLLDRQAQLSRAQFEDYLRLDSVIATDGLSVSPQS